ncbi:MAG TPA: hypothetical protein PL009_02260 [Flavipsychrobacter sp.]|nr:hypothetical protein [Flavipsychrobacter sp.]
MKKFFVLILLSMLGFIESKAIQVVNNSACDICVLRICYDATCRISSETWYFVAAGNTLIVPDCSPANCTAYKLVTGASRLEDCENTSGPGITIASTAFSGCGNGTCPQFPQFDSICDVTATVVNPTLLQIQ